MTEDRRPRRELEALQEIGRTEARTGAAALLAALFLATAFGVPGLQAIAEVRAASGGRGSPWAAFSDLGAALPRAREVARREGWWAANRTLLRTMAAFEDGLEEASLLRRELLPSTQSLLTAAVGAGNEEAYPGRRGWLFYRLDVDYATGPGFLGARVLEARRQGGEAWEAAPRPDPIPALLGFAADLAARGIRLAVFPTPVKPTVHPEALSSRYPPAAGPVRNPSFGRFRRQLEEAGIPVFDPGGILVAAKARTGAAQYLETDTHWRPEALDLAARELAAFLEGRGLIPPGPRVAYRRRPAVVENLGDITRLLRLPEGQRLYPPERVTALRVLDPEGRSWRPQREAPVLLLGDSFTNVYAQAGLGWGEGAGLAEQLSFHLGRPVDRIAVNAGGAHASREALRDRLLRGEGPLEGKAVVVYQFAARELAVGDWRLAELPATGVEPPGR